MRPEAQFAAFLADAYRLGREVKPLPPVESLVRGLFRDHHLVSLPEADKLRAENARLREALVGMASERVPDEVVEALLTWARMLWEHGALRDGGAPSEVEIRAVLAAHRLAQLPEEPDLRALRARFEEADDA